MVGKLSYEKYHNESFKAKDIDPSISVLEISGEPV